MASDPARPTLTIITPVNNEEKALPEFFKRVYAVREKLIDRYNVELLFTNNASTDGTLSLITKLREQHPWVYVITMTRNFGYKGSLECGLRSAKGDLFAYIDVDLEDRPEMIMDFLRYHEEEGYDIVYGERSDRTEPKHINFLRKVFYRTLKCFADEDIIVDMAEFSLFTLEVREAMIQEKTAYPFVRASIARVGFKRKGISYKRDPRIGGVTHFPPKTMVTFAIAAILSTSTLFVKLPIYTFPIWFLAVVSLSVWRVYCESRWIDAGIIALCALYFGLSLAFAALYVGRCYKASLRRPNYIISKKDTFAQP
ncbi:MAG: glycosyltransferase family 2 protein [Cyanobacteria bacterium]|nr:glycosyltransferase family 2 protein [Cyanobacteriota bacterium]